MFATCPQCRRDYFVEAALVCPECGASLVQSEEPDDPPSAPPISLPQPHLGWALTATFVCFVLSRPAAEALSAAANYFDPSLAADPEWASILGFVAVSLLFAVVALVCARQSIRRRLSVFPSLWQVLLALGVVVPTYLLSATLAAWLTGRQLDSYPGDTYDHWFAYRALARQSWLWLVIIGCIMPAITEEAFFRCFLGRGLVARYGAAAGVLITSGLFGLVHLEPSHMVTAFLWGVVLHVCYLSSQSLWTPIAVHALSNLLIYAMFKQELSGAWPPSLSTQLASAWLMLPAALGVAGLLVLMWQTRRQALADDGSALPTASDGVSSLAEESARFATRAASRKDWLLGGTAVAIFCVATIGYALYQRDTFQAIAVLQSADAALKAGEYAEADERYSRVIELAPADAGAWCGRSIARTELFDHENALFDAERAIELDPGYAGAIAAKASALLGLQRAEEALVAANLAAEIQPDNAWIRGVQTQVAAAARDYAAAIAAAEAGRRLDKSNYYFPFMLAHIYVSCPYRHFRNAERAAALAEEACRLSSFQNADPLLTLCTVRWNAGKYDEALALLQQAAACNQGANIAYAAHLLHDAAASAKIVEALRSAWPDVLVDDVVRYQPHKTAYIMVPDDQLAVAQQLKIPPNLLDGWRCQVTSLIECEDNIVKFAAQLRQCGIEAEIAEQITWSIAMDAQVFAAIDNGELAKLLKRDETAIAELKAKLRQITPDS